MDEKIKKDLAERLRHLDVAWSAMNGQDPQPISGTYTQAGWWAQALAGETNPWRLSADDAAYQVLQHLVPRHEATTTGFWGSDLGRAIARNGWAPIGNDGETVNATAAAACLGVTRQRVFELQKKGRLRTPAQVAEALQLRGEK